MKQLQHNQIGNPGDVKWYINELIALNIIINTAAMGKEMLYKESFFFSRKLTSECLA